MRYKTSTESVNAAQSISSMCLVCGEHNPLSLHAQFLELEDGRLYGEFTTVDAHQSYPGRVHGGIISAILDEAIGRAVQVNDPEFFGVTMELTVRYRKPVPLNTRLRVIAEITEHRHQVFIGNAKLLLEDDSVAADAQGKFFQMETAAISDGGLSDEDWHPDPREHPDSIVA